VWVLRQLHGNQPAPDPLLRIAAYGADQLGLGAHTESLVHGSQVIPHRGLADLHELRDVRHAASIEEIGEHHRETTSTSCELIAPAAPLSYSEQFVAFLVPLHWCDEFQKSCHLHLMCID